MLLKVTRLSKLILSDRSHMVKGRFPLLENSEEKATSLQESPIFFTFKDGKFR